MNNANKWIIISVIAMIGLVLWGTLLRPSAPPGPNAGAAPVSKFPKSAANPDRGPSTAKPVASIPSEPSRNPRPRSGSSKKVITDPDARAALKRVGFDPDAEQYWLAAINNPFLPPDERQDLIEDLNEDGLSDPRNPRPDDLPLIESRIHLIEQLMPDALDEVNSDAFKEARKDLVNMRARLTRR
jgi:hypothetical protein